jgi:kynurenine formamidase
MATLGPADGHSGGRPTADAAARSPATATCFAGVTDLTHPLPETFPSANGERWLRIEDFCSFEETGINFKIWHMHEHLGTHIDAPIHFSKDGATCDRISARSLVVPLAVVDIRARAAETPDAQLTPDDIRTWESANGELPNGCCLALNSGWDRRASGPGYRNADDTGTMHFPGIHSEAAQMLLEEREVAGLGVDTLSIDHGPSTDFPTHRRWLPAGRWAVEGLANLDEVPALGATIVIGAPTVEGATGGPSRIFALV